MKRINRRRGAARPAAEPYEAQFRSLIEAGADGMIVVARDGAIAFANPAACALMGRSAEELASRPFGVPIVPDETAEVDVFRPDGTARVAEMRSVAITWDGRPAYLAALRDATERKQIEDAVRRQNERLRLLDQAAAHLLAADAPEALARGLFDLVRDHLDVDVYCCQSVAETGDALILDSCAGVPDESLPAFARLAFGEGVCGESARLRRPVVVAGLQGSDEPGTALLRSLGVRACACHPLLADGRLLGVLSFASRSRERFSDDELEFLGTLSRYAAAAYERLGLIGRLREADRRKDEFLAMLAHELRNPLAAVSNAVRLAVRSEAAEQQAWSHEVIIRQCRQLARLIDDLLDVSRITRGKIQLRKERVDGAAILRGAVAAVRPLVEQRGHALQTFIPAEPIALDADPTRLEQIVTNLLANAAKYTEPGGWITLDARRDGSDLLVAIRDGGVGIAPEMLAKVFEPFTQVERSIDRAQGGLGIGLTLVRSLAELHGGSVSAASDGLGRGSEFVVRLPLPAASAASSAAAERDSDGPATPTRPISDRSARVLVVDDNRDAARTTAALVEEFGHAARVAHDGPSALESAREFRPEVVLLDIGLPVMDGYQVAEALRRLPGADGMLIIAVTGYGEEQVANRAREAGFDHRFIKPIDVDGLLALLARPAGAAEPEAE